MTPDASTLTTARNHHHAGDLRTAERLYRQVLDHEPGRADVWCLLGELCQAQGRREEAAACYQNSLRLQPQNPGAHNNRGIVLLEQGQLDQAAACFREALCLQPDYPEALNNLGITLLEQGRTKEAGKAFREALHLRPAYPEAWNSLGKALTRLGQAEAAVDAYRQALALQPGYLLAHRNLARLLRDLGRRTEAIFSYQAALRLDPAQPDLHNELGVQYLAAGQFAEAVASYRQALLLQPGHAETHNNLGIAHLHQGHWAEAVALFRQALRLRPDFPVAYNNLGNALAAQDQPTEAIACYQEALRLWPDYAEARHNLGLALAGQGQPDEALVCYDEAIRLKPDYPEALNNLGNAYKDQGRLDEAIACYRRALALRPGEAAFHSNLLYALLYHPGYDPAAILAEHREYGRRHAAPAITSPLEVERRLGRRLRLGYLSPDFRHHVVGRHMEAVLRTHDHRQFEVICYAHVLHPDGLTQRLRQLADGWRSLVGLSDDQTAVLIRQDQIDILVDLAGHTGGNRLPVFARRPAPVQVTHYGYLATTGLETIDYRLSDALLDPPGMTEAHYTETLVRLPDHFWCYTPSTDQEVGPLPAEKAGHVTFGSFNNPAKLSEPALALWARVLQAVPGSHLHLLTGTGQGANRRVLDMLTRNGVEGERITLLGKQHGDDYWALYREVDVCLDPFPYAGCNTSADSLWMGVPVVTLAGQTGIARQGVSLLGHLGLWDWIAESSDAYVAVAVRLARDPIGLDEMRRSLRERLRRSTLTDPVRF
ncbi:MAG: tetratricopeptide repeat protein, partial [Planctomycetes bacterium]|nr:tetratricopeptide repeat protein [Planctomycetota bacterium]